MFGIEVKPIYIIAECAQGYASSSLEESIALALLLTRCAKASGAEAVKFQLVIASELATQDYKHYDLFKSLELGFSGWQQVAALAKTLELDLIFDIFGPSSLLMAENLGASAVKIHPTDFTNLELIRKVASSSVKNVIAGCGGATRSEIEMTIKELVNSESLTLLHGFQGYPTPRADNCLSRLGFLKGLIDQSTIPLKLGFADHADPSSPDSTHLAGVSLGYGVSVLEKHLTIAKCLQLEDHESALSPDEFHAFVEIINNCYDAKSQSFILETSFDLPDSEKAYRKAVARHVVAKFDLDSNHTIGSSDICLKRTGSSDFISDPLLVIGKKTTMPIKADSPFTFATVEQ